MKQVRRLKEPTVKQMLNMASNLKEKFNKPSVIETIAWHNYLIFNLYVEDLFNKKFDSWKECQDFYFEVMREEKK